MLNTTTLNSEQDIEEARHSQRSMNDSIGGLRKSSERIKKGSVVPWYALEYIITLFWNVILLSLYTVMVFAVHTPCLTNTGHNITDSFEIAFQIGFAL